MSSTTSVALTPSSNLRLAKVKRNADYLARLLSSPHVRPNTKKNFKSDWNAWAQFMETQPGGIEAFLALTKAEQQMPQLQGYVEYLLANQLTAGTVKKYIAGLANILKLLGAQNGCDDPLFRFYLKTTLQAVAKPAAQANPVRLDMVNRILQDIDPDGDIRAFRAGMIVQLAYDTLCRASELIELRQSDIDFKANGTATVFIRRSKNDQAAVGAYRFVSKSTVNLLKRWIAMANEAGRFDYLLCPISSHSNKIRKLKQGKEENTIGYSRLLGDIKLLLGRDYSAHSTRVGSLLDLVSCPDNKDVDVQLAGGWKSGAMVVYYSRESSAENGAMARLSKLNGR